MAKFKLSTADFYLLQQAITKKISNSEQVRSKAFWASVVAWIPFGVGSFSLVRFFQINPEISDALTQIVVCFLLWLVLFFAVSIYRQRLLLNSWINPDGWFLREQQIGFSEIGFEIKSESSHAFFSWLAVIEYNEDATNHYLFIDASQAVIIPKLVVNQTTGANEHLQSGLNHLHQNNKSQ